MIIIIIANLEGFCSADFVILLSMGPLLCPVEQ